MAHAEHIIGAGALLIACATMAPPLPAQPIYRCANNYSQTPCPGGIAIDVDDSRSPAQKAQTDSATAQAVRTANEMEKTRLKGEQSAGKTARPPTATTKSMPVKRAADKPGRGQKDKQPGPFVAFAPAQEKPIAKKPERAATKP